MIILRKKTVADDTVVKMGKQYWLAKYTSIITLALIGVRFLLSHYTNLNFLPDSLFLTLVGGAIFLLAFMLSGTLQDFKESEELPGTIAASILNLYDGGKFAKGLNPNFDLDLLTARLLRIIGTIKSDIGGRHLQKQALGAVSELSESLMELERLHINSIYLGRMKDVRDDLNKDIFRAYQIKATAFVPAGYVILQILAAFIVVGMVLVKLDSLLESILLPAMIIFFFVYMVWLIRDMDDPFNGNVVVSLFLLDDLKSKIEEAGKTPTSGDVGARDTRKVAQ